MRWPLVALAPLLLACRAAAERQVEAPEPINQAEEEALKCRVERDLYLDFQQYKHYTCAFCYKLIPDVLFSGKLRFSKSKPLYLLEDESRQVWPNETARIRPTFKSDATFDKWRECCRQAIECCLRNAKQLATFARQLPNGKLVDKPDLQHCQPTWDGMSCWRATPTNTLAQHECPDHIYFFDFVPICKAQVVKQCFANATWYVRGDHEWSNYSNCDGLSLYATRLLMAGAWHLFSALVIGPALLVLSRLPNRGGSKRVRILSKLLFWLLVNGLLAATQNIGIIGGFFHARKTFGDEAGSALRRAEQVAAPAAGRLAPAGQQLAPAASQQLATWNQTLASSGRLSDHLNCDSSIASDNKISAQGRRCKRDLNHRQLKQRQEQSALVVLLCWIVSVGIRVTRLLGYAWMFTGAVYLCSVLHFAPAEPPTAFIKWLMILTNGFPIVIGLVYILIRTIYEPSPLTLLLKLPYLYLRGDNERAQELWASQLDCWVLASKLDFVEEIADLPNLVLTILNLGLFVITLIIMCRISGPGSTRPEMSLADYFKAAGTLVLLYGAHYTLSFIRPPEESCIKAQVIHYLFLFVDGIQGIAVSYVFCYKTTEGREILAKWWASWRPLLLCKRTNQLQTDHHLLNQARPFNHSTRSNNSQCNGRDLNTELIDINDTPAASQF